MRRDRHLKGICTMRHWHFIVVLFTFANLGGVSAQASDSENCLKIDTIYPPWKIEEALSDLKTKQKDIRKKITDFEGQLRQIRPEFLKAGRDHRDWQLKVALIENELESAKKKYEHKISGISHKISEFKKQISELDTRIGNLPSGALKSETIQEQMTLQSELNRRSNFLKQLQAERDSKIAELEKKRASNIDRVGESEKNVSKWTHTIETVESNLTREENALKQNQHCQVQAEKAQKFGEAELWKTPRKLRDLEARLDRMDRKVRKIDGKLSKVHGVLKVANCTYTFRRKRSTYSGAWHFMDLVRNDDFAGIVGTSCRGNMTDVRVGRASHSAAIASWVIGAWFPADCIEAQFDLIFIDGLVNPHVQGWDNSAKDRLKPIKEKSYCSDGRPFIRRP